MNRFYSTVRVCSLLLVPGLCFTHSAQAAPAPEQLPPGQTPPIAPNITQVPLPPRVTLPPPPVPSTEVPQRPLTADEAARIALRKQPNIVVAAAGVTAAQG